MEPKDLQEWFGGHAKTVVEAWLPTWAANVVENVRRGYIREDRSLHRLAGMFPAIASCVLAGPGPSLDLAIPWIKAEPQNLIACHSSLNPLFGNGLGPFVTVACDPQASLGDKIAEVAHMVHATDILVCPVTIHPSVIEHWPGQLALYVTHDPTPPYAGVQIVVDNVLAKVGLDKQSLGFITAGGCVGCAALEAAFVAGFRDVKIVGYELGGMPNGRYYGQRFDFSQTPPAPLCIEEPARDSKATMYLKSQSDRYRLAFEQRLEWMTGQDPAFTWSNLSPYSFVQGNRENIPAIELVEDLVEVT